MFAEIHSTLLYQSRFCFDFDSGLSELTGSAKKWGKNRFSNFCAFVRKFTRELVGEGDLLTLSLYRVFVVVVVACFDLRRSTELHYETATAGFATRLVAGRDFAYGFG